MSRFLTRLVDRTLGTASAIEPVRLPLFMDASSITSKSAGYEDAGFAYGDLIRSTQILPQQNLNDTDGIADPVSREVKEEDTSVHSPDSRQRDASLPVPDVSKSVTKGLSRKNHEHDVTLYRTRETPRHAVQAERVPAESCSPPTERGPITQHSAQKITIQPVNHSANQRLHPQRDVDTGESVQMDIGERQLKSSNSLPLVNSDSVMSPRVSPASPLQSILVQQIMSRQEKVQSRASKPPIIQVTIGRIEVKAVTVPPSPQAPRSRTKSQPSLSLDDYLKQRSGDQR